MKRIAKSPDVEKRKAVECPVCGGVFRSDHLNRHLLTHNQFKSCRYCKNQIRSDKLFRHEVLCKSLVDERLCNRFNVESLHHTTHCSSVSGHFTCLELAVEDEIDYDAILWNACADAKRLLESLLSHHPVKAQLVLVLSFYRQPEDRNEVSEKVFRSICEPLLLGDDIDEFLARVRIYIRGQIQNYERLGSGWIYEGLKCARLEVAKYNPLSGSGTVEIPNKVKNMKSVLNIKSPDNRCFLYCLVAGKLNLLNQLPKHSERYTKYLNKLNCVKMGSVSFPVKLKDIPKIEELNDLSISVFQWCAKDDCVLPLKHGSGTGNQIDLLYIEDENTAHYLLIKNFNAFMRHRTKYHHSMFYCRKCLTGFKYGKSHAEHIKLCNQRVNQRVMMPKPGYTEFKAFHKQEKKLFVVYYDWECLTTPYQEDPLKISNSTTKYR